MSKAANWDEVSELLDALYNSTDRLEEIFPGRKFTLDGHLIGSVGEVVAAYMFDLKLNPASTLGHDAIASDGRKVEIKLTQGNRVAFRHEPEHAIILYRPKGGPIQVVYNGPGYLVWRSAGKMQKNGQRSISISLLTRLSEELSAGLKLTVFRSSPV